MKKIIFLFLASTSLLNCQKKITVDKTVEKNTDIELIKKHMKLQEKIELSENDTNIANQYRLNDSDIELGGEVVLQGMKNSGYIIPDPKDFSEKIKEVFEETPNSHNTAIKKHNIFITFFVSPNQEKDLAQTEYDYTYDHIFTFPKYGIITTLPLLNDLATLKDNNLSIHLDQNTIARNKYLFNNSKGDLTWLLANDKDFLKNLLIYFGYDKEEKINEMVLKNLLHEYSNEIPSSNGKIGNVFFVKGYNGKLQIRKNLLKYIEKTITKDYDEYISALSEYKISILYSPENQSSFNDEEKAEIVANISNIEIPAFNKYKGQSDQAWNQKASTLFYLQSKDAMNLPEILDILKRHNYFGFSYLKNYIENGQLEDENPTSPQGDE
ncbi:hypothetical protein PGH12_10540 [Chryseobacterium wangxinyae]|uniref:hypothetical protein n=1 Tax=Chryseobacterium sp. CY350 TaxID=2997336 RepID=UPI0022709447|nr:hypothetical protein [Chryseobacterium sp. CY350]MCY0978705.1 hypothetical protein [Chryseobacterium sp. CY350]WBZ93914.1 hypothetical protein PGH12_10540 [Chryseobacterium sp. CY350]